MRATVKGHGFFGDKNGIFSKKNENSEKRRCVLRSRVTNLTGISRRVFLKVEKRIFKGHKFDIRKKRSRVTEEGVISGGRDPGPSV